MLKPLQWLFVILFFALLLNQCSSIKSDRTAKPKVPIAILITTDNSPDIIGLGIDYYTYNLMDVLDNFPEYEPVLVEYDEHPEVVFHLAIENFNIWPKDERVYRRSFSRAIQTGVSANGQPLYETISASAEIVQISIRSNVRFSTNLSLNNTAGSKVYRQIFSPSLTWQTNFVRSIQGDSRALDPSLLSGGFMEGMEPTPNDLLLKLSRKEMLDRIAYEIRTHY